MTIPEGYTGPATLLADGGVELTVRIQLSGQVEPTDGQYHWVGRIAPHDDVSQIARDGAKSPKLRVGTGEQVPVKLGAVDPWGGVRVTGTGAAPWPPDADDHADDHPEDSDPDRSDRDVDVAIIGAGFGGLGAAIRLQQEGFNDFLVLEKADDVGGTWRDNTYPGCACDVPSHLYSFSFALNPSWSDTFSGQQEIWDYLRACVRRYGLAPHLRLGHTVGDLRWDGARRRWEIETSRGTYTARVVISASGPLSEPSIPDLPGLETFGGTVFHSARWRHDHDLTGRRVAVIGTGASAIQFVPAIAGTVDRLTLFQRTPAWVVPRRSRPISRAELAAYRHVPGAQRLTRTALYWAREGMGIGFLWPRVNRLAQRLAVGHLHRQVRDPDLRAKLTPTYTLGCKRVLLSNDYYPALTRDNVDVVTESIKAVRPGGIVTADGTADGQEHPVDTIIFGTGFHVTDMPIQDRIFGRDGQRLGEAWTPTLRAHLGTTVAGFPNLFVLLGPNTGLGHTSAVLMIESQLQQVIAALRHMRRTRVRAIEPTEDAQNRYNQIVDAKMDGTVWVSGGCSSWYLDATGRNSTIWPGFATSYRLRTRRFRAGDYRTVPAEAPADTPEETPTLVGQV